MYSFTHTSYVHTYKQTDKQTNKQSNKQTNKQTNKETRRKTDTLAWVNLWSPGGSFMVQKMAITSPHQRLLTLLTLGVRVAFSQRAFWFYALREKTLGYSSETNHRNFSKILSL